MFLTDSLALNFRMFDSVDAGGGSADAGSASPASGAGDGAGNAGSPPAGSGAGSPPAAAGDGNIKQLREAYNTLKGEHESYTALGKVDDIKGNMDFASNVMKSAVELGKALGYDEDEIRTSMRNDWEFTLNFLREKKTEADSKGNISPEVKGLQDEVANLKKSIKPLTDSEQARVMKEANQRFDSAFDQQLKDAFKDEKLSQEELDFLYETTIGYFRTDEEARNRFFKENKVSDVAKYFLKAKESFDKMYLARVSREKERIHGPEPGRDKNEPTRKKVSFDDFIKGNVPKDHPAARLLNE